MKLGGGGSVCLSHLLRRPRDTMICWLRESVRDESGPALAIRTIARQTERTKREREREIYIACRTN